MNTKKTDIEGTILYENLTDEEAEKIINDLLKSSDKNFEEVERLEAVILEN